MIIEARGHATPHSASRQLGSPGAACDVSSCGGVPANVRLPYPWYARIRSVLGVAQYIQLASRRDSVHMTHVISSAMTS